MKSPKISIVVSIDVFHPVHSFLDGFMQQSCPFDDFEVIVVDTEPREAISEAIAEARTKTQGALSIRYLTVENSRRAAQNNFGVAKSRSELIIFNCNDFVPTPNFANAHLSFHQDHPESHIVGIGPGVFSEAQRQASRFVTWLEDSGKLFGFSFTGKEVHIPTSFFYVANTSVKKDFLVAAGGFDEDFRYPCYDDYEMGVRLARNGMIALFVPEGLGLHDHPITVVERVRSMRRAGESVAMFATKSGDRLITQDPMWKYSLHRLACLFDGRANAREIYWELILGAAFTWGYIRESFR